MPFGKTRTAATYRKEILKHISGSEVAGNAIVDGTLVPLDANGRRILEAGTVMVYEGVNEQQTVSVNATGGTFTLTFNTHTTAAIPENATAAQVQAAYGALSDFAPGDILVTGDPGGPWLIEYTGTKSATNVAAPTLDATGLTGGGASGTVTTTTGGSSTRASGQRVKPAPSGIAAADVAGILMETTEFWTEADLTHADDEPVALYQKNCHFNSTQLVGYAANSAAVKSAMTGAGNDRCANCSFEA